MVLPEKVGGRSCPAWKDSGKTRFAESRVAGRGQAPQTVCCRLPELCLGVKGAEGLRLVLPGTLEEPGRIMFSAKFMPFCFVYLALYEHTDWGGGRGQ